ncbi:putative phiE125 gp8 family phage protein [Silvibacterium bohemicum]|uniref:Putative phiE125 gp8 family phage protein n=1 Tax=Silvibacterium bohemicum TaxID=1577686 RepID=A0A841K0I4_9BACT|nr:head-tail connector protein [Silvibacterium bohemicum]MBB6144721.1 putative phiE125 gp8 family phage protein [Silvibacterium bohemicum]
MPLSLQLVTPPAAEPVSLSLAKQHLRVDFSDDDVLIAALITAARQYCEKYTHRAFFNQTWLRTLDYFPLWYNPDGTVNPRYRSDWPYYADFWGRIAIDLPRPRTVSVTSITYVDPTGTTQTLDPSTYVVDTTSMPARIVPAKGFYWPSVNVYQPGGVKITYVAGSYGDGVDVNTCPQTIVMAMLLLIAHWYEHREGSSELNLKNIPLGVQALLDTEKLQVFEYRP